MNRPHQEVRPSQFVMTYGPGSILETRSGPVVIGSLDGLFGSLSPRGPADFEILDERLSRAELAGARIVRIPTNAELEVPDDESVYPSEGFPYWGLCTKHSPQILFSCTTGCPLCAGGRGAGGGATAIRFVRACPEGHLDDVDWHFVVHGSGRCKPSHYLWKGGGRALRHVQIECPNCTAVANLGTAYGKTWPCSGRFPELGRRGSGCGTPARILQRGAANLHMPCVVSALTLADIPSRLHDALKDRRILAIAGVLKRLGMLDKAKFESELQAEGVATAAIGYLAGQPWTDVSAALDQLLQTSNSSTTSLRDEEFDRLVKAATTGAPSVPPTTPGSPPLFEVRLADVRRFLGPSSRLQFRVTPVSRLRVVMVQTGYQRVDPDQATKVPVNMDRNREQWLPGVELFGEGIFIDLDGADASLGGTRTDTWSRLYATTPDEIRSHPHHVWWHTLAHRLITALSIDSGYSSSAIRERVYLKEGAGGLHLGGILLYTVQPGGDGTLGGLVSLVPRFGRILSAALDDVDTCSNDPICSETRIAHMQGSACYSCLLVSETSCEHRNLGLDRLVLAENLP